MAEEEIVESSLPVIEDVNLDEFLSDADKQQQTYNAKQELKQVINIPERKGEPTPITDILFGPRNVELSGDSFITAGKSARRIAERVAGVKEEDLEPVGDIDPINGFVAGVVNGSILIPYGFVNITAEISDALRKDKVPVNENYVAQLEKYFSNTVLGKIQQGSEDIVKETAIGKLTSAMIQLYGYGKMGSTGAVAIAEKAKQIYNKFSSAAKINKVSAGSAAAAKAGMKAQDLNKITGMKKHVAVVIGGGAGAATLVTDIEDIGTWGDWLGGPSALDKEPREDSNDDAIRKLYNRFKFFAEGSLVSVPLVYGGNLLAKRIAEHGKEIKYSNDLIDRWIGKWIQEPLLPEGSKNRFLFEGMKRVEGEMAAGQVVAKDLIIDIDQTLYRIAKESGIKTSNPAWEKIAGRLDELLTSSDDAVQGGKLIFKGFNQKKLTQFQEFIKEVGLSKQNADDLISEMFKVRNQFNVFKNTFLKEAKGNLNLANKEFQQLMSERMNSIFSSEYRIFTEKSVLPWLNYKPTESLINDVKEVFKRYAKEHKTVLTDTDLDSMIGDVLKNVRRNPLTKTPEFPLTVLNPLEDSATQYINIANNIKGLQFKPTTLIQSEKDLRAFQRFFGMKKDIRNTISNTMSDLSSIVAKNRFYQSLLDESKKLIAKGERAIVYPTRLEALNGLRHQTIIDKNGLKVTSSLGEAAYSNPLDGYFTSKGFQDAINFSEKMMMDGIAKNILYQSVFLIPKGLTQISKTMLGPFTHARNFITSAQFSLASGNLFKNPVDMVRNFKKAWDTIQPQLAPGGNSSLWDPVKKVATLGLSYRNAPKDQALYRFLLEEQVVSSSATARDIAGILDDIGRRGDSIMRIFGGLGRAAKKIYNVAANTYVAEDDIFKIYNFLAEYDSYKNSYSKALKKGLIKTMPNDLSIMKEAAGIVKNTVPNYNYVGPFGQGVRRLPLGNFVSFPIEVTRTSHGILSQGLKEMDNPIFRDIGMKRLVGFGTAVVTAPALITATLQGMYGITTDMISAARELVVPDWAQDSTVALIRDKDRKLKYVDISSFLVYDTVQNPIVSIIAGAERERTFAPNEPLTVGIGKGLAKGVARFLRPFVEESIYLNVFNNIMVRDGVTADGRSLWNKELPGWEKFQIALEYAAMEVAPGSAKQFGRLYDAFLDQPGERGQKYKVSDELAGFYGLRPVEIDSLKSLNYKITEFKSGLRDTLGIFTKDTQKGGAIAPNKIIERFITANAQRYEKYNFIKRKIKAAQILEASEDSVYDLFKRRGETRNYNDIIENRFKPFNITKNVKEGFERIQDELRRNFDDANIPAGLPDYVEDILNNLKETMENIPLGDNFYKYIKPEDWFIKDDRQGSLPGASSEKQVTQVPPLAPQPMPNPQIISPPMPQMSQLNQGLTPTENALLSDSEKQIRLQHRGLS
jgi:hypothetical protein